MSGAQTAERRGMQKALFYGFNLEWYVPRARQDREVVDRAKVLWSRTTRDGILRAIPS